MKTYIAPVLWTYSVKSPVKGQRDVTDFIFGLDHFTYTHDLFMCLVADIKRMNGKPFKTFNVTDRRATIIVPTENGDIRYLFIVCPEWLFRLWNRVKRRLDRLNVKR